MKILTSFSARLNKMPRAALITIGLFVALGTFAHGSLPRTPALKTCWKPELDQMEPTGSARTIWGATPSAG